MKSMLRKFYNKKLYTFKGEGMGNFEVTIYRFHMDINTVSGNFSCRIRATQHPYLYLLAAATQGKVDQIYGYCMILFTVANTLTTDQKLTNDVVKAIKNWTKRHEDMGAAKAENVTTDENEFALKEVKSNVERGKMTRQQRRKEERDAKKKK